jgi:microcystin-dependent protein
MAQYPNRFEGITVYGLPTNPTLGTIAVDTADGNLKKYNGATWDIVGTGAGGGTTITGVNQDVFDTTVFDGNSLTDFTQTGLVLSTNNPLKGTKSALLIHQSAVNQSFKKVIALDRKFRSKNMTLSLTNRSSAYASNLTLTITDETNATVLLSSPINTDKLAFTVNTASSTTISVIPSTIITSLAVGQTITGAGIPSNTIISSINVGAFTAVISNAATATATGASVSTSALPTARSFAFDVPANCASLSYTITALPEANLAESYIDDVSIQLTAGLLLSGSINIPKNNNTNATLVPITGSWVTNTSYTNWVSRRGDIAHFEGIVSLTGAPTATPLILTLPSGYVIDATKTPAQNVRATYPSAIKVFDSSAGTQPGAGFVQGVSTTQVQLDYLVPSMAAITDASPMVFATGDSIYYSFDIPIVGWSATDTTNIAQSFSQAALVANPDLSLIMSSGTLAGSQSALDFSTTNYNIGSGIRYDGTTKRFIATEAGLFNFSATDESASTAQNTLILVANINGSDLSIAEDDNATAQYRSSISSTVYLNVNDYVRIQASNSRGTGGNRVISISKAGSLKQVNPQLNQKITIPTHALRFDGASTKGSTDTAIVKFDTQTSVLGDGLSVVNNTVNGTVVTVQKAGLLNVSASLYATVSNTVAISLNQAVLTSFPQTTEVIALEATAGTNDQFNLGVTIPVKVGDKIRVSSSAAITATSQNFINFSLQEQSFPLAISNIWQQNGSGYDESNILLQNFDVAQLGDFTQTGLNLILTNALNGAKSAQLISNSSINQSFKQIFQVAPKFRGANLTISHDIVSTVSQGNLTLTITDETNATVLASSSIPTGSQSVLGTVTNTSATLTAVSNAIINGLSVGMRVTGTGIPTGTLISSMNAIAGTITLSQTATSAGTSVRISDIPRIPQVSFTVPASCGSLSYTFTALPESSNPETYIDGINVSMTSGIILNGTVQVPNLTAWNTYVPTIVGFGTIATQSFRWRQVGDSIQLEGRFTSGTPTAIEARIPLPNSLLSMSDYATLEIVGKSATNNSNQEMISLIEPSVGYLTFGFANSTSAELTKVNGSQLVTTGQFVSINASVRVAGLTATKNIASSFSQAALVANPDSYLRVDNNSAASTFGSTATAVRRFSTVRENIGSSVQFLDDSVNGSRFIIQEAGVFSISATDGFTPSGVYFGITKNASTVTTNPTSMAPSEVLAINFMITATANTSCAWEGYLNVGDIIRIQASPSVAGQVSQASTVSFTKQGSLKQIQPQLNNKITIPTHNLRFEGSSTRGSTDTAIVKFDTQTITQGDGFSVVNSTANGTVVTIKKAGTLNVSTILSISALNDVYISKNQAVLTAAPTVPETVARFSETNVGGYLQNISATIPVNVGDIIRVAAPASTPNTGYNTFVLFLTETSFPLAISNIWQQNGAGFNPDNLLLQQFDTAVLGDFTQTGLNLILTNALNGAKTAQLIHQSATNQSFKQTFQVSPKFRGKNLTLKHDVLSTATSGNLTLTVTDETNSVVLVNASSVPTNSQSVTATVTNTSATLTAVSNAIINGLSVGMRVTGTGIPTGTLITALSAVNGTITISQAATSAGTAVRISSLPTIQKVSFDVPANCGLLSYLFTALPDSLAETYIDGMSVDITSQSLMSTSINIPVVEDSLEILLKAPSAFTNSAAVDTLIPYSASSSTFGTYPISSSSVAIQKSGRYRIKIKSDVFGNGETVTLKISINGIKTSGAPHTIDVNGSGSWSHFEDNFIISLVQGDIVSSYILIANARSVQASELLLEYAPQATTNSTTIPLTTAQLVQQPDSMIRLNTGNGYASTYPLVIRRFANIVSSIGADVQYNDSATLGASFSILTPGEYFISYTDLTGGINETIGLSLNTTQPTQGINLLTNPAEALSMQTSVSAAVPTTTTWQGYLNAGDIVRPHNNVSTSANNGKTQFTISKQGSLKQLNASSDSKITIPTHQLRFEGASTRGSTDTTIVKFDTQTLTQGDAWDVVNTAANGTVVTMKKAGSLSISANLRTGDNTVVITLNQAVLTTSPVASEVLSCSENAATRSKAVAWTGIVKIGDKLRISCDVAPTANYNSLNFSLTETSIPANFSNVLPQWSQSDSSVRLQTGNGMGSSNTQVRRFSTTVTNLGSSITYTDSATLGASFTANEDGVYDISYSDAAASAANDLVISLNATTIATGSILAIERASSGGADYATASCSTYLVKGDVVRALCGVTLTTHPFATFSISKQGKPNLSSVDVSSFINLKLPDTNIVGEIVAFAGAATPANFLACDGAAVSRTTYSDLFNTIGTTYGVGDGSTTFNTPNLKGIFLKGAGSQTIGGVVHAGTLGVTENDQMQGHFHNLTSAAWGFTGSGSNNAPSVGSAAAVGGTLGPVSDGVNGTPRTGTETKPANVAINYIIRYLPNQTGVVTPTVQVSSDTMAFNFKATAIDPSVDPIGTFNTFTHAINSNTITLAATAPTQTTSSMNINGVQVIARAYNTTSTAALPSRFDIYIGKGLKSRAVDMYEGLAKTIASTYDYFIQTTTVEKGVNVVYNEINGVLTIDAGTAQQSSNTTRLISGFGGNSSGYFVFNASKSPSLLSIPNLNLKSAYITDVKTVAAGGGTSVSTTWTTRDLNTLNDPNGIITSLASNQFTLPAGTYEFNITAPYQSGSATAAMTRLRNITDGTTIDEQQTYVAPLNGPDCYTTFGNVFTITSPKIFAVQYWVAVGQSAYGLGQNSTVTGENNVFTRVKLTKIK